MEGHQVMRREFAGSSVVVAIVMVLGTSRFAALGGSADRSSPVHALFSLEEPQGGPFPSDRFTVPDPSQNTLIRVSLPLPNCDEHPSDCEDLDVVNTLDGFNLQPRLSIPFEAPV